MFTSLIGCWETSGRSGTTANNRPDSHVQQRHVVDGDQLVVGEELTVDPGLAVNVESADEYAHTSVGQR